MKSLPKMWRKKYAIVFASTQLRMTRLRKYPIDPKAYLGCWETPYDGGTKVCSNGPGHMTKMAATHIYGKNPSKIFFSRTRRPMTLGLGM